MAATTMKVSVAGDGNKDGTTWGHAMDMAAWLGNMNDVPDAGDVYHVMTGTYTTGGTSIDTTARDGTFASPVRIIGVQDESDTWATGSNCPNIVLGADTWRLGDHYQMENLRGTVASQYGYRLDSYGLVRNCKFEQISETANYYGIYGGTGTRFVDSWAKAHDNGIAIRMVYGSVYGCYLKDSAYGISLGQSFGSVGFCVFDGCVDGLYTGGSDAINVRNNTFYGCGTAGFRIGAEGFGHVVQNNIFSGCDYGLKATALYGDNISDYNVFHNSTTGHRLNWNKGNNDMDGVDPDFANAAGASFSGFRPKNWSNILGFPGSGLVCGAVQPRRAVRLVD